jgi:hypothetical protein
MLGNSVFYKDLNLSEACYNIGYSVTCSYLYNFFLQTHSLLEFYDYQLIAPIFYGLSSTDVLVSTTTLYLSNATLLNSALIDTEVSSNLVTSPFSDSVKNLLFSSSVNTLAQLNCFESVFIKESLNNYFFFNFLLNSTLTCKLLYFFDNSFFFFKLVLLLLFISFFLCFFVVVYLSPFTNNSKEENSGDFNILLTSLLFEAEKEIGSVDDIIFALFIIFYLFFWYFYTYFLTILFILPDLVLMFYTLPLLYFIIILMPTMLLVDFGVYFLMYLKGSANSSLLVCEVAFDYIAVCVFYTRLIVQGVRLVLMIATYMGLNEVIVYFNYSVDAMLMYDTQIDKQFNFCRNLNEVTYYFVLVLPSKIIY